MRAPLFGLLFASCFVFAGAGPCISQDGGHAAAKTDEFFPEIDLGGHRSFVFSMAFTADGLGLVTGSADKTVRVWNVTTGSSRAIRGESASDDAGRIYAVALAPSGKLIAAGGNFSNTPPRGDIRLIDAQSGALVGRLAGHSRIIRDLAYSADGKQLASLDGSGTIKIWDVEQRREILSIANKKPANHLAFLPGSAIAISAGDGVHVFDLNGGALVKSLTTGSEAQDFSVSADGSRIAAAEKAGTVRIWSWPQGELVWEFKPAAISQSIAFGRQSTTGLLAVGSGDQPYDVTVWDTATKKLVATYKGHDNIVQRLTFSPNGLDIASSGGNANQIDVWSVSRPTTAKRSLRGGGRTVWATGFLRAPDNSPKAGTYIAWGYEDPCPGLPSCPEKPGALSHALRLPDSRLPVLGSPGELAEGARLSEGKNSVGVATYRALLTAGGARLSRKSEDDPERWPILELETQGTTSPIDKRKKNRGEDHYSYSFDPSGRWIVSGGRNGILEKYERDGTQPLALIGHDGDVPTVTVSPDRRLILSGGSDQTTRLWNSETGELIVSLLHLPSDGRWIMWTPQGYFAAAPNSEALIGWRVNRGPDAAADFVTASELSEHFHSSALVARAIVLGSAKAAIDEFRADGHISRLDLGDVISRGLPQVAVVAPKNPVNPNLPFATTVGWTQVILATFDQPVPIERYTVYVNGTEVIDQPAAGLTDPTGRNVSLNVPLFGGLNQIRVVARNRDLIDREMSVTVNLMATEGPLDRRENAYIVAVGVNGYVAAPRLRYARADAVAFATQMAEKLKKTHNVVHPPILLIESAGPPLPNPMAFDVRPPTRANIAAALKSFSAAGKRDTIVLFLAGHGSNRVGAARDFSFLPIDAARDQNGLTAASVLPWRDVQTALDRGLGRKLIFIDACRSSSLYDSGLVTDLVRQSNVVFSSTQPQQDALEGIAFPNGEFTHFLVVGLEGKANTNGGGLTDQELGTFVSDEVANSTNGLQRPSWNRPLSMPIFDVVRY